MVKVDEKSLLLATSMCLDPSEREVRRLFWRDDMENYNICKWTPREPGVTVGYVNTAPIHGAFEGDYVLRAINPAGTEFNLDTFFGRLPNCKVSLEARWWKDSHIRWMRLAMDLYDSMRGYCTVGHLQWAANDERWKYSEAFAAKNIPGGGGTDFPEGREPIEDDTWNYAKATFDFLSNKYSRLESNGKVIDLTPFNLPLYTFASARKSSTTIVLYVRTDVANQPVYFDDVRVYINEV